MRSAGSELAETFDRVHALQRRNAPGVESVPQLERTSSLVRGLRALIRDREIRSIVDLGCGDASWWELVLDETSEGRIRYHGFDISPAVVALNRARFEDRLNLRFDMADARFQDIPEADLLICRRTLNHLWSADAALIRRNTERRARLLAFTHDPTVRQNPPDGLRVQLSPDTPRATRFTPLNMRRPPFMPMPVVATIDDDDDQVLAFFPGHSFA